jgi:hypothetical protein
MPDAGFELLGLARASPRSRLGHDGVGQRMLAALIEAGRRRSTSSSSNPGCGPHAVEGRLPSVSVPVLSTISVSTLRSRSMAAASRNSTPWVAAAAGGDHDRHRRRQPSAQGQAMISTATALIRP